MIKQAFRDFPEVYNSITGKLDDTEIFYLILATNQQLPGTVHLLMFLKCIELLGTE